jgi:prolyl-tRNA synthetase
LIVNKTQVTFAFEIKNGLVCLLLTLNFAQQPYHANMSDKLTSRAVDYSKWYNELVVQADLADHSAVRGCMVIKPYGYAIWEKMRDALDKMFKDTGHVNAYFPLFVPKSFLEKEEGHAEGFAKECAVVTHYRLKANPDQKGSLMVDPDSKLEEELIVRPTSEAIIWNTYKGWIQSYRDLPILVNQWANVVRWEMRTRLFLRTAEFLWQEGHTAHATSQEAIVETEKMLGVYAEFAEKWMAMPVVKGRKTASERFAGALDTMCIEAMMQDGKALQAGTSHFLGQNFAKAFDVKFTSKEGAQDFVWATSWGVSTRLMGALIMTHSDDKGLRLPPMLAPIHIVIVPIYKGLDQLEEIKSKMQPLMADLKAKGITVKFDDDDTKRSGWKFAEYELKGVPVRIAVGPKDMENGTLEVARRDNGTKQSIAQDGAAETLTKLLDDIQENLYQEALQLRTGLVTKVDSYEEFKKLLDEKGGFFFAHWDGTAETEEKVKNETKATIRCIPLNPSDFGMTDDEGVCMVTGQPSSRRVLFARAY